MKDTITEKVTTVTTETNDAVENFLKYFKESSFALLILGAGFALHEAIKQGYPVNIGIGEFNISVGGANSLICKE